MRVIQTKGEYGYTYKHITDNNYDSLKELQRQYEATAKRTWMDIIDTCHGQFCLTVEEIKI